MNDKIDYLKYLVHKITVTLSPKIEINRYFKRIYD